MRERSRRDSSTSDRSLMHALDKQWHQAPAVSAILVRSTSSTLSQLWASAARLLVREDMAALSRAARALILVGLRITVTETR